MSYNPFEIRPLPITNLLKTTSIITPIDTVQKTVSDSNHSPSSSKLSTISTTSETDVVPLVKFPNSNWDESSLIDTNMDTHMDTYQGSYTTGISCCICILLLLVILIVVGYYIYKRYAAKSDESTSESPSLPVPLFLPIPKSESRSLPKREGIH